MRTKNELYQEASPHRCPAAADRPWLWRRMHRHRPKLPFPPCVMQKKRCGCGGIRCALAGASGKDRTEAAAALADARQKLTALLAASGRPADALEPHFTCPKCQDTGSVNGRTCSCVHKVMQQLRRQEIERCPACPFPALTL